MCRGFDWLVDCWCDNIGAQVRHGRLFTQNGPKRSRWPSAVEARFEGRYRVAGSTSYSHPETSQTGRSTLLQFHRESVIEEDIASRVEAIASRLQDIDVEFRSFSPGEQLEVQRLLWCQTTMRSWSASIAKRMGISSRKFRRAPNSRTCDMSDIPCVFTSEQGMVVFLRRRVACPRSTPIYEKTWVGEMMNWGSRLPIYNQTPPGSCFLVIASCGRFAEPCLWLLPAKSCITGVSAAERSSQFGCTQTLRFAALWDFS